MGKHIITNEVNTSISTPGSGISTLFPDTDKKFKYKNDSGTTIELLDTSFQSIATAAGTTTLTNTSPNNTIFTGVTTQTCVFPDSTTLVTGKIYQIDNNSTGLVTVNANGGGALLILAANTAAYFTLLTNASGPGTWEVDYHGINITTGKVLSATNSLTLTGTDGNIITFPSGSDTAVMLTGTQTITGVKTITNPTTAAGTTLIPSMTLTAGNNMTTPTAGVVEFDGVAFYRTSDTTNGRGFDDRWAYFRLTGSGSGITTIADFFGSNDGIPLVANGVYEIEWHCYFSQATAGAATWTIVTATTALATLTGEYIGSNIAGIATVGAPQTAAINTTASSSTAFPVTGTEATGVTHFFTIRVLCTAGNGTSNTRLRLTMSAGTATPLINSYFRVRRLPAANTGIFVA